MKNLKYELMNSYGLDSEDQLVAWIQNTLVKSDADALIEELELNNRDIRTHGQTTKTGANQRPHRSSVTDSVE